jgi:hypothetical protein
MAEYASLGDMTSVLAFGRESLSQSVKGPLAFSRCFASNTTELDLALLAILGPPSRRSNFCEQQ